ncbi:MerR family transcriptional regulator [uncultured Chitinophaga sp.]|jgi:hypothetical protein|uniref:MerR family transcriptional regulator n=1 Tax=uncultured Chitinophaga sp. TaxID=339340 RepID=UPI002625B8CD|nr:MerR family transcriptional regulator [uncultured Chitinophaga sp.]
MELKVNEVASELNETAHVIRNWTRYFKQYLSLIKGEKNNYNLYPPEAMEVLRTIQRLHRQQGYSTRQIKNYLSGGELAAAAEPVVNLPTAPDEVAELRAHIAQLLEYQQRQEEFNRLLLHQLEQRELRDQARDKLITEYITESREARTRAQLEIRAAEKEQEHQKKKRWWGLK